MKSKRNFPDFDPIVKLLIVYGLVETSILKGSPYIIKLKA